jgi:asparagine synthase (glutamine-hydrolysing)
MGAIAGFWQRGPDGDAPVQCRAMLAALAGYGPDDRADSRLGDLAVGRNLYRLLPEDIHDRQPLVGGDGRFLLVADLRLDNRPELERALGITRGEAAELADSEILLRALVRWGESALDRLVGDYAFVFFDSAERRLILARDPIGQRPLFWHRGDGFFAFSSMPAGLHALPEVERRVDREAMIDFLGLLPARGPTTLYHGVQRVEPGHVLTVTADSIRSRRYWSPSRQPLRLRRFDDYVEAFRAQLDQAVASRLRGAGTLVGSHLSGGWDSSSVTATAARLLRPEGGRVVAFTSVPAPGHEGAAPLSRFGDEGPLAAATAALHDNIEHVLIPGSAESPIADLDRYDLWYDRPIATLCNHVWQAAIRGRARAAGARVVLTGEIGNWTVSAAPYYLLADYLRQGRFLGWLREATAIARRKDSRLRGITARSFGPYLPDFIWNRVRSLSSAPEMDLFSALHPSLRAGVARRQEESSQGLAHRPNDNFAEAMAAFREMDFGQLRKGALAGWGVDERDATADRRLIEFCLSLPIDLLLKDGVRRPLARAALSDRLPPAVLDERHKGYQAADWNEGMTRSRSKIAALVERIAGDPLASSLIDVNFLRRLLDEWPKDGWTQWQAIGRYRTALLMSLSSGHFILSSRP